MTNIPLVRRENLVMQKLDNEILIYDLNANEAFCLNETSGLVWQLCDGRKSVAEISEFIGKIKNQSVSEDIVWLALDQLKKEGLVLNENELVSSLAGMSRREAIKKVGLGTMIALPLISSLIAPATVHAQSRCTGPVGRAIGIACTQSCQCTSGCCRSSGPNAGTCQPTPPNNCTA